MAEVTLNSLRLRFNNKLRFVLTLGGILLVISVPYWIWAMDQEPPPPEWENIVRVRSGAFLQIDVDAATLVRQFRADSVAFVVQQANDYLSSLRPAALESRRVNYSDAAVLACRVGAANAAVPPVLAELSRNQRVSVRVDGGERELIIACSRVFAPAAQPVDSLLRTTSPDAVLGWLQTTRAQLAADCPACDQDLIDAADSAEQTLSDSIAEEGRIISNARAYVMTLDNQLSFGFLYSYGYEWLFHLLYWSWVGVITAGLAQLVIKIQNKQTSGHLFIFIALRFITAPIVAIVFVATITYGLTDQPINLAHNPMLLIFAFASGYLSESFNLMLREGLNHVIPNFAIKASNLKGAADISSAVSSVRTLATIDVETPRTLSEFGTALLGTAKRVFAETEASVAEKLVD